YDLQTFSAVLTRAVVGRQSKIDAAHLWTKWYARAREVRQLFHPPSTVVINRTTVNHHRGWCAEQSCPVTRSYGGYYFSALQAVWLDALRQTLPVREPEKTVALAAM